MKSVSPALSSFFRNRATFTVRVFSSTKLSDSHSRVMMASRLTISPRCSSKSCKILNSFRVNSTFCPLAVRVPSDTFSTAPPQESKWAVPAKS